MKDRDQLFAYVATLMTLATIFIAALVIAAVCPPIIGKIETFGLGTVCGGLIGALRFPSQRGVTVQNAPDDPVPVEPAP